MHNFHRYKAKFSLGDVGDKSFEFFGTWIGISAFILLIVATYALDSTKSAVLTITPVIGISYFCYWVVTQLNKFIVEYCLNSFHLAVLTLLLGLFLTGDGRFILFTFYFAGLFVVSAYFVIKYKDRYCSSIGKIRKTVMLLPALIIVGLIAIIAAGSVLTASANHPIANAATELDVVEVSIDKSNGSNTKGWLVEGDADKPGILLVHGVRSDRRQMLSRAKFLHAAGYTVLLIDLQAHGETLGEAITFGYLESQDVHVAVEFLRDNVRSKQVGIIGVSLGGAASILGASPAKVDALVLESVYPDINTAIDNRLSMRVGSISQWLTPLFTAQIQPRLQVLPSHLSPARYIKYASSPVLIISGTNDQHTTVEDTRRLFEQAKAPKELWLIDGAGHENLHRYAKADYETRILEFLADAFASSTYVDRR